MNLGQWCQDFLLTFTARKLQSTYRLTTTQCIIFQIHAIERVTEDMISDMSLYHYLLLESLGIIMALRARTSIVGAVVALWPEDGAYLSTC